MPIFHEAFDPTVATTAAPTQRPDHGDGVRSEEVERTWDGDQRSSGWAPSATEGHISPVLDRGELIERIKRGESPSWTSTRNQKPADSRHSPHPQSRGSSTPKLLPPLEIRTSRPNSPELTRNLLKAGMEIERPKSALHSGDFREKKESSTDDEARNVVLSTSPVAPWHPSFPTSLRPAQSELPRQRSTAFAIPQPRARAISQSAMPSSFVFMPPTSPLAKQIANNDDPEFQRLQRSSDLAKSPDRASRRHTFSPQSFQSYRYSPYDAHHPAVPRLPYQAHQPRRSIGNAAALHSTSVPQTPPLRPRRPSISSESSPHLHHAPMVGSYEESILRGRMSTTPSRPLDFLAQIGVLGKGNCKASLRCPSHATVPFPAVFYSYSSGAGRIPDNQPSPYVGLIDLENNIPPSEESGESRRRKKYASAALESGVNSGLDRSAGAIRKREKTKRRRSRSPSLKAPPGGSYRIPAEGQIQIVIKNPNKTAVKLFLVPYDLSDMPVGTKTFIRQRSYSAGPIIDMPLANRKNLGTDRPEASLSNSEDPADRPVLRYLIHLHICCTGKGRYYLYRSIRVVFANRVPDGKEKLRNEVQLPEPRYTTYKPSRDTAQTPQLSAIGSERANRRRSANPLLMNFSERMDDIDGLPPAAYLSFSAKSERSFGSAFGSMAPRPTVQPIPFRLPALESRPTSRGETMEVDFRSRPPTAERDEDDAMVSPTHELGNEFEKRKEWSGPCESLLGRGLREERGGQ